MNTTSVSFKNLFIINPWLDGLFFILTPVIILPTVFYLESQLTLQTLGFIVLAYGGLGHHLPGLIRVYTDPQLFSRYKTRFILAPIIFIGTCTLFAVYNLNGLGFIIVTWGTWHGAMQVNGFLRIYDAKVKSFSRITANLDWWMSLMWFGTAVLHSNVKQVSIIGHLYASGGALIPPVFMDYFRMAWDIVTGIVTILFLINFVVQWKKGTPANPLKILTMISSFGFWWYCMVSMNNLLIGLVMWEIFHDFQYNALVWTYNRVRVEKNLAPSKVEQFLFQPSWFKIIFYLGLILGYGHLGVLTSYVNIHLPSELVNQDTWSTWLTRVMMASGFLHFYFDGFIWKVRDASTRQSLNIKTDTGQGGLSHPEETKQDQIKKGLARGEVTPLVHGAKWLLFFIPVTYLALAEFNGWGFDSKSQHFNMTKTIPNSWYANFMVGTFHKIENDYDQALPYFEKAAKLNPKLSEAQLFLADIYYRKGNLKSAEEFYFKALALDSSLSQVSGNLAQLQLRKGDFHNALANFKRAIKIDPASPDYTFGAATALIKLQKWNEAQMYLVQTLSMSPNHVKALHYSGMFHEVRGELPQAQDLYSRSLSADPNYGPAAERLKAVQEKLQSLQK